MWTLIFEEHLYSHNLTLKDYFREKNINKLTNEEYEEYFFPLSIKKKNISFQYSLLTYIAYLLIIVFMI